MLIWLSVSHVDTSSESSGYGSLHSKFGSTSSTPSAMLASHYNNEKGSKSESSEDKSRSRSVNSASLLICVTVLFYRSTLLNRMSYPAKKISSFVVLNLIIVPSIHTTLLFLFVCVAVLLYRFCVVDLWKGKFHVRNDGNKNKKSFCFRTWERP